MPEKKQLFDRDEMAKWYAKRHLDTDNGVVEIHYLPSNAPSSEIRLLEVNNRIAETTDMEPIDFGVDIGGINQHSLFILDVTPTQWKAIQEGKLRLPKGWSLDDHKRLGKRSR